VKALRDDPDALKAPTPLEPENAPQALPGPIRRSNRTRARDDDPAPR
jgi:hypothetical protein